MLIDYQGGAVDLSEDFTVAASNVITTLVFGQEVSVCGPGCARGPWAWLQHPSLCIAVWQKFLRAATVAQLSERDRCSLGLRLDLCSGFLPSAQSQWPRFHRAVWGKANAAGIMTAYLVSSVLGKKFPNPVFSRLLREVTRRDELIRRHLNQYQVQLSPLKETP